MKQSYEACLEHIFKSEGGYVDHPRDPGGATNMGITHHTLAAWRGKPVSKRDVKHLSKAEAAKIYRANYWNKVQGDLLPPGLDLSIFDYAVNSGPGRAAKTIQRMLGVSADGAIGPVTLSAIDAVDNSPEELRTLINNYTETRLAFLRSLGTWPTFGRGWTKRVERVRESALAMAGQVIHPPAVTTPPEGTAKSWWVIMLMTLAAGLAGK